MIRIGHNLHVPRNIKSIEIINGKICRKTYLMTIVERKQDPDASTAENPVYFDYAVCKEYKSRFIRNAWFLKLLIRLLYLRGFNMPAIKKTVWS